MQPDHASRLDETAFDDGGKNQGIDIATAEHNADLLPRKSPRLLGEGCKGGGGGTLHHRLFQVQQETKRGLDVVFSGQHDIRHQPGDDGLGLLSGTLHGNALGDGGPTALDGLPGQGLLHGGKPDGLNADDLYGRVDAPCGRGDAGDEPPAPHRYDENLQVRLAGQHLEGDGSLTRDDPFIVIGMDQGESLFYGEVPGMVSGVREQFSVKDHLGPMLPCVLHLDVRGVQRHHNGGRDAELSAVVGHRLGMISRGHGDHPPFTRLGGQGTEFHQGAALLERTGVLEVFVLEKHRCTREVRELSRVSAGGFADVSGQQI